VRGYGSLIFSISKYEFHVLKEEFCFRSMEEWRPGVFLVKEYGSLILLCIKTMTFMY
jgi:hypothetical protein